MVRFFTLSLPYYYPDLKLMNLSDRHFNGEESFDPNPNIGLESASKL